MNRKTYTTKQESETRRYCCNTESKRGAAPEIVRGNLGEPPIFATSLFRQKTRRVLVSSKPMRSWNQNIDTKTESPLLHDVKLCFNELRAINSAYFSLFVFALKNTATI